MNNEIISVALRSMQCFSVFVFDKREEKRLGVHRIARVSIAS